MSDTLYTAAQIAAAAGISKTAVRKAIAARSIEPAQTYGQAMLYAAEDAETIIKAAQDRREFTENHRQPIQTNHRKPPESNDREPAETTGNDQQEKQAGSIEAPGETAETTTGNQREPTTENRQEPPTTDAAGADHDQQARYIENLERQVADLTERLDRAEHRVDILLATVYQQAAAQLPPAQPEKTRHPFLAKLRSIFFEERR